jgi:hypothetical protein
MDNRKPSFGIGQLLLAVILAILFFLLGQSMVHHRFFRGGSLDHADSLRH